jgi:Pterin 4 alpha carbinolamine dehydratase
VNGQVGELAESEGHHPDISFGWGRATVSLSTKKIKGLHENDFIMASKIDRMADRPGPTPTGTPPSQGLLLCTEQAEAGVMATAQDRITISRDTGCRLSRSLK